MAIGERSVPITQAAPVMVRANSSCLGPEAIDRDLNIEDTTPRRVTGHSGVRPFIRLAVTWTTDSGDMRQRTVWGKEVRQAEAVFHEMKRIHGILTERGIAAPMPHPLALDPKNQLILLEYRKGKALPKSVVADTLVGVPRRPSLELTFTAIGNWLADYHEALGTGTLSAPDQALARVDAALAEPSPLDAGEVGVLRGWLSRWPSLAGGTSSYENTAPHNDFTLRNILWAHPVTFSVVDWDPRLHPDYPREGPGWSDVTALVVNTASLLRFAPLVSARRLSTLIRAFLNGYGKTATPEAAAPHLWLFALQSYLGTIGDRPLYTRYSGKLLSRFTEQLRRKLVEGPEAFRDFGAW